MINAEDITATDFKAQFARGFNYGTTTESVTDEDIDSALNEALCNFNESLFGDDATLKLAFLYLAAHYLAHDLQTAAIGGPNAVASFPVSSRSVGGVSESYQLPNYVATDPVFGPLATTRYGQKYTALVKPLCIGGAQIFAGDTTP